MPTATTAQLTNSESILQRMVLTPADPVRTGKESNNIRLVRQIRLPGRRQTFVPRGLPVLLPNWLLRRRQIPVRQQPRQ